MKANYPVTWPPALRKAFEKIGRSRRSGARVGIGKDISPQTYKRLQKLNLVMPLKYSDRAMFTYNGERFWTALHPTSKYRVR